ncbi:MAG: hypothetical protein ACI9N0_001429 [Ilumatobacter sp.]|jgi:uncharacterized protein YcbX
MHVTELWRYPVKSMGGEQLDAAHVGELGIAGDRGWGVFDVATGTVLTARRSPQLLFASARVVDSDVVIEVPEIGQVASGEASAALSRWLGQEVELRAAGDVGGTYEVPLDFEHDADWVSWTGPAGAWHDSKSSRVSLVSTATLGDWDLRRFRTNIVVSGSGEDDFVGHHLQIGAVGSGAELAVIKQIDRCVMVTRPQPGLDRDIELLKTINRDRATLLSIGSQIAVPGNVAIGDEVRLLPASS